MRGVKAPRLFNMKLCKRLKLAWGCLRGDYVSSRTWSTDLFETYGDDIENGDFVRFEGSLLYKWVYFQTGSALAKSTFHYITKDGTNTPTVEGGAVGATDVVAGISSIAVATGAYGWIQIGGLGEMLSITGNDGDLIHITSTVTDTTEQVNGIALDASAGKILLSCPW